MVRRGDEAEGTLCCVMETEGCVEGVKGGGGGGGGSFRWLKESKTGGGDALAGHPPDGRPRA